MTKVIWKFCNICNLKFFIHVMRFCFCVFSWSKSVFVADVLYNSNTTNHNDNINNKSNKITILVNKKRENKKHLDLSHLQSTLQAVRDASKKFYFTSSHNFFFKFHCKMSSPILVKKGNCKLSWLRVPWSWKLRALYCMIHNCSNTVNVDLLCMVIKFVG